MDDEYSDTNPFVVRQRISDSSREALEEEVDLEEDLPIELPSYSTQHGKHASNRRIEVMGVGVGMGMFAPPEWWFRLSRKQRRILTVITTGCFCALIVIVSASLSTSWRSWSPSAPNLSTSGHDAESAAAADPCTWNQLYLPRTIRPVFYNLAVTTNLSIPYIVTGSVDIHLQISQDTRCLVLHSGPDLSILSAIVEVNGSAALLGARVLLHSSRWHVTGAMCSDGAAAVSV